MTMESIEKLRTWVNDLLYSRDVREEFASLCDEVQAEIESRYMELPVDAEGEPIKMGDRVIDECKHSFQVGALHVYIDGEWNVGVMGTLPASLRHVKPRTVEDVLEDVVKLCFNAKKQGFDAEYVMSSGNIADFAAELQMRGDAE